MSMPTAEYITSEGAEKHATYGGQHDDEPGRQLPADQQAEIDEGQGEVRRHQDGAGPYRLVERGQQEAHYRRIDPGERRPHRRPRSEHVPEGQRAEDEQERG